MTELNFHETQRIGPIICFSPNLFFSIFPNSNLKNLLLKSEKKYWITSCFCFYLKMELFFFLTLKGTPSFPCRKWQPSRGNETSLKVSHATKFRFWGKNLVDYFGKCYSPWTPQPPFFFNENEKFLRITWHFALFLLFF